MNAFDARLYLDFNIFAERTTWLHGFARAYALYLGLAALAVAAVVSWWRGRDIRWSRRAGNQLVDAVWTPVAAAVAFGLAIPIANAIGRPRPYVTLHNTIELLVARAGGGGLPNPQAAAAGAVIAGLWLTRDRIVAACSTAIGLLLCVFWVYVGASYPGDVLTGLAFGAVLLVALRPLARQLMSTIAGLGHRGVAARLEASPPRSSAAGLRGPVDSETSGTVKILEPNARPIPLVTDPDVIHVARGPRPAAVHVTPRGRGSTVAPEEGKEEHDVAATDEPKKRSIARGARSSS